MPLVYFRFAKPLASTEIKISVDLSEVHVIKNRTKSLSFCVTAQPLYYNNKKVIIDAVNSVEGDGFHKKMFTSLLKNGNKSDKVIAQFFSNNKHLKNIAAVSETIIGKKKEVLKYFKDKSTGDFDTETKEVLDAFQKIANEDNYANVSISFAEHTLYFAIA
jgi:hypothetical protein